MLEETKFTKNELLSMIFHDATDFNIVMQACFYFYVRMPFMMEKASKATPYSMPKVGTNGWGDLLTCCENLAHNGRAHSWSKLE